MTAEPGDGEWTFQSQDTTWASYVIYDNDTWLLVQTVETTPFYYDTKFFTSDAPEDGWTERLTVYSWKAGDPTTIQRVLFADGKWVVASLFQATFLVVEADFSSYSLETVPSGLGPYDVGYGDGYWLCVSPILGGGKKMYRATSISGSWTEVSSTDLQSVNPTTVAYNGERWVAGGLIPAVGPAIVTTTDPTGAWTTCTITSTASLNDAVSLLWFPELSEWLMGFLVTGTNVSYRWASSDAATWEAIGYTLGVTPPLASPMFAYGDNYIVQVGRYTGGAATRTTYISADSFGDTGSATVLDAANNTSSSDSINCVAYGDGKFVMALKPTTKSTFGTVTSPFEDGLTGWGMLL